MTKTTSPQPDPDLDKAFPHATYAWLRRTVRATLEARPNAAKITLDADAISQAERETLRWLLRLPALPHGTVRISVSRLDQALTSRTDAALDTRALLEALDGPLGNLPDERRRDATEREQVWARAATHPAVSQSLLLQRWLEREASSGRIPADPAIRDRALSSALDVLAALPCTRPTPLTVLAARTLGAAHALDPGLTAGLVLRALAHQQGRPAPATPSAERELWLSQQVIPDELSSRVLLHGFRPTDQDPVSRILRISAEAGTPCVLTLQQVDRRLGATNAPLLEPGSDVWVFENVAVMSELASRLAGCCPPLVCAEGWPSLTAVKIVQYLHATGCRLHYHGDFDKSGLAITEAMISLGAEPWLMDAHSYLEAVDALENLPALPTAAMRDNALPWAPGLTEAIQVHGRQVEEEHLIDRLAAAILSSADPLHRSRQPAPPRRESDDVTASREASL